MDLYNPDNRLYSTFNIGVIIPGLMLGFNMQMLESLDIMGREIRKYHKGYKLPIVITSWEYTWNKIWLRYVIEKASKFQHIIIYPYTEPYNSAGFNRFVQRFYSNFDIHGELGIPAGIFKTLAVHYINKRGVDHATNKVRPLDKKSEWYFFKLKSPSIFNIGNGHIIDELLNLPNLVDNKFIPQERYFMNSMIDLMVFDEITNNSISELVYSGSLSSMRRIFKLNDNALADELANFYKLNLYVDSHEFNNGSELQYYIGTPTNGRFEGRYIFSHLVKSADPLVNFICNSFFHKRAHPSVLYSPKVFVDVNGKYNIDENNVKDSLIHLRESTGSDYVLPEDVLQTLKYTAF